ncbi:MAG: hypothetical protein H0V26_06230 [Solirubrobacterales bacterium]|nr:hypothetical protein [Solirubrobacterales bacterium]
MSDTYRVAHLDDLDRIPVDGGQEFSLTWLPVRRSLGIRAFGTNAFVAESAGDHVVEPHTELGAEHEELYFVARGRATFTLGEETVDAPAAGSYEVSAWEWTFRAAAVRYSNPAAARAILDDGLRVRPEAGSLHYELACLDALSGDHEAALAALSEAVQLRPETAAWAYDDEDLASIHDDPRFVALTTRNP